MSRTRRRNYIRRNKLAPTTPISPSREEEIMRFDPKWQARFRRYDQKYHRGADGVGRPVKFGSAKNGRYDTWDDVGSDADTRIARRQLRRQLNDFENHLEDHM